MDEPIAVGDRLSVPEINLLLLLDGAGTILRAVMAWFGAHSMPSTSAICWSWPSTSLNEWDTELPSEVWEELPPPRRNGAGLTRWPVALVTGRYCYKSG